MSRFISVTKVNDEYQVNTNASLVEATPKGMSIASYDTAYCFLNIEESPMVPKKGGTTYEAPTAESWELWSESDATYDSASKAVFASNYYSIMLTNGYTGYAIMKVGNKIYAFDLDTTDTIVDGIELEFDSTLPVPIVTNHSGVEYESGHLVTVTDKNNYHIKFNGDDGFYSYEDNIWNAVYGDSDYYSPDSSDVYQYITVGALDTTNRTINIKRYCLQGID